MMSYSNIYDAIPVCRMHARSLCVHPNFQATTRATSDNFVARNTRCRFLCVHTLRVNSHVRFVSDYLAVHQSLVSAILELQVAVGKSPKSTATSSRLGRLDSGYISHIFYGSGHDAHCSRHSYQVPTGCGRQTANSAVAAATSRLRPVWLTRLLVSDFFCGSYRRSLGDYADTDCKLAFVCVAFCDFVLNLRDISIIRNLTAI